MKLPVIIKLLPIVLFLCLSGSFLLGQKVELRISSSAGLFYFRGNGSTSSATGFSNHYAFYGRKPGFSYSTGLQAQFVTHQKHLFGLGAAIEKVKSSAATTIVATDIVGNEPLPPPEYGKTIVKSTFFSLTPFLGQRIEGRVVSLDILAGIDLAFRMKNVVNIKSPSSGRDDSFTYLKDEISRALDWRPRIQFNVNYKNFSLIAAYSLGLVNYQTYSSYKAHSNFVTAGLGYKLK